MRGLAPHISMKGRVYAPFRLNMNLILKDFKAFEFDFKDFDFKRFKKL
jgi:hypothetical protein